MGGKNFGWLAVWFLSPDRLNPKPEIGEFVRCLGEAAASGEGECGPCPAFIS
jgi:hypothetical protein